MFRGRGEARLGLEFRKYFGPGIWSLEFEVLYDSNNETNEAKK